MKARMPVANESVAAGVNSANLMKMQQLAGQAPQSTDAAQVATAGAQIASAAGQAQLGKTAAAIQQPIQAAQNVVAARRSDAQAAAAGRELAVAAAQTGNELKLAQMDSELKREMVDARARFATDESGRLVLNASQLADLAVSKARSREELEGKLQSMEQVSKRKLQATELMYKRAMQDLDFRTQQAIQSGNQQAAQSIAAYKNQIAAAFQAEVAEAQNKAMLIQTIFGIGGAVIGGLSTMSPMGAAFGYSAGTGAGAVAANSGAANNI
jgi:hypothetical protein